MRFWAIVPGGNVLCSVEPRFGDEAGQIGCAPGVTWEILRACGYGDREIAAMEEQGIIGVPGDPDVYNRYWSSKFDGKKK